MVIVVFWNPLSALVSLALRDEHYSHTILIPFISAMLVCIRRRQVFRASRLCPGVGLPLLIFGLGAYWISTRSLLSAAVGLSLAAASLILVWIAGFILCYGTEAFKAALFPLFFLVFMIPAPPILLGKVVAVLQAGSAAGTSLLFRALQVPVFREGFSFTVPDLTIDIGPECSSIRSSTALCITGVLAGHFLLRTGGRRICLVLLTVPIAIFTNAVRIVTLTCLALYLDRSFLFGWLHRSGGAAFSMISVAILLSVLALLRKSESHRREKVGAIYVRP